MVRWTQARIEHITTRSDRYPEASVIDPAWADEAAADPAAVVSDPDPRSITGAVRIVGYSPLAGFVVTVIAVRVNGDLWGSPRGRPPELNAAPTRRPDMAKRTDPDIDAALVPTAAEYIEEEAHAAREEAQAATASAVFSVRLSPSKDAVRAAAAQQNVIPSALIRQWVTQRVEQTGQGDLATAVAVLRHDLERVADLVPRSNPVQ